MVIYAKFNITSILDPIKENIILLLDLEGKLKTQGAKDCFAEVVSFMGNSESLEEIAFMRVPDGIQKRIEELLDKNSNDVLTKDEELEMDEYQEINYVGILIKSAANKLLKN